MPDVQKIATKLSLALATAGLDLTATFDVARYNSTVSETAPLECFGRKGALALIIGNTHALWGPFVKAYRSRNDLQAHTDPLNAYIEGAISGVLSAVSIGHAIRYAHDSGEKVVAIQKAARISGLAAHGPANLSAHPAHGPWIGLRAVVSFDCTPPANAIDQATLPCSGCAAPCELALKDALAATRERSRTGMEAVWEKWLAVRDTCPVGRGSRYSNGQIRYHYLKDRNALSLSDEPEY